MHKVQIKGHDGTYTRSVAVDENGYVKVNVKEITDIELDITPSTIGTGRKLVTPAGTPAQLIATPVTAQYVIVSAVSTNTSPVVIGGSTVIATPPTRRGTPLSVVSGVPDTITIPINDVSKLYVDSIVSNEGVVFTYLK